MRSTTITKTEKERRWRAEWDFWWRNKVDVACSQETGLAGDDGDLRQVRRWLLKWSKENNAAAAMWTCTGPGGAAAGLVVTALGTWAHSGRANRSWPDGRGLWVEFSAAGANFAVGNVYGPASGNEQEKADWREEVAAERAGIMERGVKVLVMGDVNQKWALEDVSHGQARDRRLQAWLREENIGDAWRVRHGTTKAGWTRREESNGKETTFTRIDVGWLDEAGKAALRQAWLAGWDDVPGNRDHRELMIELSLGQWLATANSDGSQVHQEDAMPDFPPRRWFIVDDEDRLRVAAMRRPGELPRKIERDAFNTCLQSKALEPQREACEIASLNSEMSPCLANTEALWQATLALGRTMRDSLQSLIREPFQQKNGRKGEPNYGREWNRLMGLRRWLRRLMRHGDAAMSPAARNKATPLWRRAPGEEINAPVPEEILEMWRTARLPAEPGGGGGGGNRNLARPAPTKIPRHGRAGKTTHGSAPTLTPNG